MKQFNINKKEEKWEIEIGTLSGTEDEVEDYIWALQRQFENAILGEKYKKQGWITLHTHLEYDDWRNEEFMLAFTVSYDWLMHVLEEEEETLRSLLETELQEREIYVRAKSENVVIKEEEIVIENK